MNRVCNNVYYRKGEIIRECVSDRLEIIIQLERSPTTIATSFGYRATEYHSKKVMILIGMDNPAAHRVFPR